jgi:adenine-specific DNA-methyltransferase
MDSLKRLQELLRDLFQLDLADLDFGIYRLLRMKKDDVEAFLNEQLPRRVNESFAGVTAEERSRVEGEVAQLTKRIRNEIADDALTPTGDVRDDYKNLKVKSAKELIDEYVAK